MAELLSHDFMPLDDSFFQLLESLATTGGVSRFIHLDMSGGLLGVCLCMLEIEEIAKHTEPIFLSSA